MAKQLKNELDTVVFGVDVNECKLLTDIPQSCSILGLKYVKTKEKIPKYKKSRIFEEPKDIFVFTASSKLFSAPDDIGRISIDNFERIAPTIENVFGIVVDPNYLYEKALLLRADIKRDLIMKDNPDYTISTIRRVSKRDTAKYEIHNYENTTYSHGLAIVPKTKKNYRLSIYNKGREMSLKRNKEIYEQFNYDYLDTLNHMIRCEMQLRNFKDIKNAFHIPHDEPQTFNAVFECPYNVVYEQFCRLLKGVINED